MLGKSRQLPLSGLTSSLGDSPAPMLAMLARVLASTVLKAVFGPKCTGSFASVDRVTCSLKTCQHSLTEGLSVSCVTLPQSGLMRCGFLYERVTSAHPTTAGVSLSLRGEVSTEAEGLPTKVQPAPSAQLWPTPVWRDGKSTRRHGYATGKPGTTLTDAMLAHHSVGPRDPKTAKGGQAGKPSMVLNPEFVETMLGFPRGHTGSRR